MRTVMTITEEGKGRSARAGGGQSSHQRTLPFENHEYILTQGEADSLFSAANVWI